MSLLQEHAFPLAMDGSDGGSDVRRSMDLSLCSSGDRVSRDFAVTCARAVSTAGSLDGARRAAAEHEDGYCGMADGVSFHLARLADGDESALGGLADALVQVRQEMDVGGAAGHKVLGMASDLVKSALGHDAEARTRLTSAIESSARMRAHHRALNAAHVMHGAGMAEKDKADDGADAVERIEESAMKFDPHLEDLKRYSSAYETAGVLHMSLMQHYIDGGDPCLGDEKESTCTAEEYQKGHLYQSTLTPLPGAYTWGPFAPPGW